MIFQVGRGGVDRSRIDHSCPLGVAFVRPGLSRFVFFHARVACEVARDVSTLMALSCPDEPEGTHAYLDRRCKSSSSSRGSKTPVRMPDDKLLSRAPPATPPAKSWANCSANRPRTHHVVNVHGTVGCQTQAADSASEPTVA